MSNLYGSIEGVFRTKHEVIKNIEEITKRFTMENRDKMIEKCNEFLKRLATTSFMFDFDWISELLCGDMYKNSFTVRIKMNREKESKHLCYQNSLIGVTLKIKNYKTRAYAKNHQEQQRTLEN